MSLKSTPLPNIVSIVASVALCISVAIAESDNGSKVQVGGLSFSRPEGWTPVEVTGMRKAQFKVAGEAGAAEVVFFHFGSGQGGDVDSNVKRWFGQFTADQQAEKVEKIAVNGVQITIASTAGTYNPPPFAQGGGGPKADYALLGAIIPGKDGDVFVRMTGPKTTVEANRKQFLEFIKGGVAK
jgi:hypothetical protein